MIQLSLSHLADAAQGKLLCSEAMSHIKVGNIVTDSRLFNSNQQSTDAFLALKGTNFDGHRFVGQVIEHGAKVIIVDHHISELDDQNVAQIIVEDTRIALGQIAAYNKAKVSPKTVGITGSSGKTTVKEMLTAILSRLGNVLATQGNFNNDIGVPLTLLRLNASHDFAVIEMGANHIGEIAYTTDLVKPDIAMINNIAAAHLEGFGDLCGVARAKGEIYSGLSENGIGLYNQDTQYTSKWQWRLTDKKVRTFSCAQSNTNADVYSSNIKLNDNGCAQFELNSAQDHCLITLTVPGKHNVCNAVAAAAAAIECGASLDDIRLGLMEMTPVKGRLNIHALGHSLRLIDDTYNANVESIKAAIDLLANFSGQRILVLGDMAELGCDARSYHQEVGEYARAQGIDVLFTLGVLSHNTSDAFGKNNQSECHHFSDRAALLEQLSVLVTPLLTEESAVQSEDKEINHSQILVKGSRSAHMEYVVEAIIGWHEQSNQRHNLKKQGNA